MVPTQAAATRGRSRGISAGVAGRGARAGIVAALLGAGRCGAFVTCPSGTWLPDADLKRLATDYIDVYYLHRDDLETPLEEPVAALGKLLAQGKIRYWGFSNFDGWRVAELVRVADSLGVARPIVMQPLYNAMNRMIEQEHLPACAHFGIGVVPYSPLARGVLTGKYAPGVAPPTDSRAGRKDQRILESEFRPESLALAQTIKAHAERRGMTTGQFALNWVLGNALVNAIIVGPKTMAQWQDYLSTLDHDFTAEDEALIDQLVVPGFNSTPFFGDVKLPPRGRVARANA